MDSMSEGRLQRCLGMGVWRGTVESQRAAGLAAWNHRLIAAGQSSRRPLLELACLQLQFLKSCSFWETRDRETREQKYGVLRRGPGARDLCSVVVMGKKAVSIHVPSDRWG